MIQFVRLHALQDAAQCCGVLQVSIMAVGARENAVADIKPLTNTLRSAYFSTGWQAQSREQQHTLSCVR